MSNFVSCDSGYGHDLTEDRLADINRFRQQSNKYLDDEAAIHVHRKNEKPKLTSTPFIQWLE